MKKVSGCWVIFFGCLAIPAAFYYSIQLWNYFTKQAELSALVKTEKLELPPAYKGFLDAIDSSMGRQQMRAIYDSAVKDKANAGYPFNRDEIRQFVESTPIFGRRDIDVITVKIVNVGRKAASNVKVFFPAAGLAQITKDDNAVDASEHTNWIELGTLEPSSQFVITFWTGNAPVFVNRDIRVNSDEGAASVRQWYVSRDENHWVIGFGPTEIFFFGFIGLIVCFMVLGAIVNATQSRSKKTAGPQEAQKD